MLIFWTAAGSGKRQRNAQTGRWKKTAPRAACLKQLESYGIVAVANQLTVTLETGR
jgi:hypothetical protein